MARKHKHEEHANHEAWAIPYGDLVTLLLAFFVVMYAISSINQGKYRVLADSLEAAFGGPPRSIQPIQLGTSTPLGSKLETSNPSMISGARSPLAPAPLRARPAAVNRLQEQLRANLPDPVLAADRRSVAKAQETLSQISDAISQALGGLIQNGQVQVRRTDLWVEVDIKSDILFPSGSATPNRDAEEVLMALATALQPFPNSIRVEGHTDDLPIATAVFPSNWELSTARAASVVHLFEAAFVDPTRLSIVGYGQQRPIADNSTPEGRNANRRVMIVILAELADEQTVDSTPVDSVESAPDAVETGTADEAPAPVDAAPDQPPSDAVPQEPEI